MYFKDKNLKESNPSSSTMIMNLVVLDTQSIIYVVTRFKFNWKKG